MRTMTSKPTKQRKMLFNAPDHIRARMLSAHLSESLRKTYGTRSITVRRGDSVRVVRGDYKGYEGKIIRVDRKKYRIFIEGITREKADGSTVLIPIHPSKVEITKINLDDKWREKILKRKHSTRATETPGGEEIGEVGKPKLEKEVISEQVGEVERE
ncbi:MAG: 50S ribosomal protein L24 [Nitrososphaerota archaeon]|nr:50S ribosomal protein L24 [Candidatus Bathyarchaeota archaeon]MDW8048278.1 50S ribosomal protein L24 [Nitrososphaerota archaeon]